MKKASLTVAVALILSSGSTFGAWGSEKASPAVQAEFADFFATFKTALKANDAEAVAGMTKLPFQNDPSISSAAQFQTKIYKENFTRKSRACLQRGPASYSRDQENNDTYDVFCGELIFTFTKTPRGFLFTDISVND